MLKYIAATLIFSLSNLAVADDSLFDPCVPANQRTASRMEPGQILLCPTPKTLIKKNDHTWCYKDTYSNAWRSTAPSFIPQPDTFYGAQFSGFGIGKIICVYGISSNNKFPILLQYNHNVSAPTDKNWKSNKHGVINCKSLNSDPADCPFKPKPPEKKENTLDKALKIPLQKPINTEFQ